MTREDDDPAFARIAEAMHKIQQCVAQGREDMRVHEAKDEGAQKLIAWKLGIITWLMGTFLTASFGIMAALATRWLAG